MDRAPEPKDKGPIDDMTLGRLARSHYIVVRESDPAASVMFCMLNRPGEIAIVVRQIPARDACNVLGVIDRQRIAAER